MRATVLALAWILAALAAACGDAHPAACDPGSAAVGDLCVECRSTPCASAMECVLAAGEGVEICDPDCGDVGGCRPCAGDADCRVAFGEGTTCGPAGGCCQAGVPGTSRLFCGF